MEKDKVSLIVAIYKSEKFLDKLINSLINQTYKNLEIILVDDGSPDNSGKICDEFAKKDKRIKVIHQENKGTCAARNIGLENVSGEYIMIIDGDDWLSRDCVEYMMKLINETHSDMAFSDKIFTTRDQVQEKDDKIEIWSAEKATAAIIYPYMKLGPWNKIYSTKLIKNNNISFSVPWFGEGLYFASTASQYANHIGVGHRKVYNYRLNNENSGLSNYNVINGKNALKNIYTIKDNLHIKSKTIDGAIDWHIWKNYTFLLLQIIGTKTEKENNEEYKKCLRYIRKNMMSVFLKSKVDFKEKIKILLCGMFPILYTKSVIFKKKMTFKKDNMK